ncbi:MAG TPA: alpha/beta hydrolase [Pirellulales bacterium]|nr:alpha/beta hydrolase [Pirellulales bacterium]
MVDEQQPAPARRFRRRIWLILPIGYLFCLGLLMFFEESLIFMPMRYPGGNWQPPGLAVEDAWFEADGLKLHGWFVEAKEPRAAVLIAHGNAGNVTHRDDLLRHFSRLGASVMVFDYRGYGRSEGRPSEAGVLADARSARRWLAERAGGEERDIVLCGESLGGGVQVDLAAKDGARGLILISTFDSLPTVAAYHYPWFPVRWLMRTRLDSVAKIAAYHGPLLEIHGEWDTIVPLAMAQRLFDAANEPKELVIVKRGDHNDPLGMEALSAIDRFFRRLAAGGDGANGQTVKRP